MSVDVYDIYANNENSSQIVIRELMNDEKWSLIIDNLLNFLEIEKIKINGSGGCKHGIEKEYILIVKKDDAPKVLGHIFERGIKMKGRVEILN